MTRGSRSMRSEEHRECTRRDTVAKEHRTLSGPLNCWRRYRKSRPRAAARDSFRQSRSRALMVRSFTFHRENVREQSLRDLPEREDLDTIPSLSQWVLIKHSANWILK